MRNAPSGAAEWTCPLCGRKAKRRHTLYGTLVCRKCFHGLANRRQLAYVVDWILYFVAANVAITIVDRFLAVTRANSQSVFWIEVALSWIAFPLVFFLKDGFRGHSPGKFLMGVRAVDQRTHEPIGFSRSLRRNLVLMIPLMPLIVAVLLTKGPRLGDGWARSKVIWKRYALHPVFTGRAACPRCHFDLTANVSGICPECGFELPPAPMPPAPPPPPRTVATG